MCSVSLARVGMGLELGPEFKWWWKGKGEEGYRGSGQGFTGSGGEGVASGGVAEVAALQGR